MNNINDDGLINLMCAILEQTRKDLLNSSLFSEEFIDATTFMLDGTFESISGYNGYEAYTKLMDERRNNESRKSDDVIRKYK